MSWLLALLPDEFLPLLIAGIGLALILRILRVQAAMAIIGGILLSLLLGPFVEAILDFLPMWVSLLVLLFVGMSLLRGFLSLILGERAADHMVGSLAAELVKGLFSLLILPLRLIVLAFRRDGRERGR
jgi:hypothetical protein